MNRETINRTILFISLVLLQILVLNNINFLGYINPFLYILFIFYYPIKKIDYNLILLSFFLGLSIDYFSNTGGINAAATLLIAFIRVPVLKVVTGKRELDYSSLSIDKLPFGRKYTYILALTLIHHFTIFGLEYFKWSSIGIILQKTLLTTVFTMILVMISFTFVSRK
jgi:rod shape-determining protein MreD